MEKFKEIGFLVDHSTFNVAVKRKVTDEDRRSWTESQRAEDEVFERDLQSLQPDWARVLSGTMLETWDGNHKLLALRRLQEEQPDTSTLWMFRLQCSIIKYDKEQEIELLKAFTDLNA